jgi:hypothetical protein
MKEAPAIPLFARGTTNCGKSAEDSRNGNVSEVPGDHGMGRGNQSARADLRRTPPTRGLRPAGIYQ